MTNQEIKTLVVDKIIDNMKISFDNNSGNAERVCIFANADSSEETMKQKAVIDEMVKILTENGYKITLNDTDISQYNGKRSSFQSAILRKEQE